MPELERLQINIDADASGAKKGAAEAKQAMQELGATTQKATGTVDKSMSAASRAVGKLRSALGLADKAGQGMAKGTSAQMENLERILEAQIAKGEALKATISRLNAELAAAKRQDSTTGSAKAGKMVESLTDKLTTKDLQLAKMTQQIDTTARKIWDLEDAAQKAGDQMEEMGRKAARGSGRSKTIFGGISRSLRSMLIITAVSRGVVNFIGWLGRVVAADAQVSASLAAVRQNLLTAFAPIYNAALPAIQTLVGWLVSATQAISNFINALFGMTGKQATNIANKIGGIGGAAGGSAKQVNELLASFDELNKLGSGGGSGGGGGGGGSGGGGGGIGGIGSDAVADSIETINGEGNVAAATLGSLTQKVAAYGTALYGLSKINKWTIAQGWGGLSKGAFFKKAGLIGVGLDAVISGTMAAKSEWFAQKKDRWATETAGGNVFQKIGESMRLASEYITGTIGGMLPGATGATFMPIYEEAVRKEFESLDQTLQTTYEQMQGEQRKPWWQMTITEAAALSLFGDRGENVGAEITTIGQKASTAIRSIGTNVGNAMNEAMAIIRNGGGGVAASGGGGRGGITEYISDYLTVDEAEVNGKINRLQDIARAVRQGIENAESIINDTMRNKETAKPVGSDMPLGMDSQTIAAWASGTVNEKADRNSAQDLANAVAGILQGTSVNVDGKKLGELAVKAINKNARTAGRVDYAY